MKRTILAATAGVLVGGLLFSTSAQDVAARILGARFSHDSLESYEMSVGVTSQGDPKRPTRLEDVREHINIPDHYGSLRQVTSDGDRAVLWFVDQGGVVRNVVIPESSTRLVRVERTKIRKLEISAIRD